MAVRFESTIWTLIKEAGDKNTVALNNFIARYKDPIKKYLVLQGFDEHDSQDLSQEVFLELFRSDALKKAKEPKGRFRSYLIGIIKNIVRRYKKSGQGLSTKSLDAAEEDPGYEEDKNFDKLWVMNILKIALGNLKKESEHKHTPYYQAIKLFLKGNDYKTIAQKLKKDLKDIDNYVYRGKIKLIEFIENEIANYSFTEEEYEHELEYLSDYLVNQ